MSAENISGSRQACKNERRCQKNKTFFKFPIISFDTVLIFSSSLHANASCPPLHRVLQHWMSSSHLPLQTAHSALGNPGIIPNPWITCNPWIRLRRSIVFIAMIRADSKSLGSKHSHTRYLAKNDYIILSLWAGCVLKEPELFYYKLCVSLGRKVSSV